jgi:hypothetical protein
LSGQGVHHHVHHRTPQHERIVLTYEITVGHNVFRKPATVLMLSWPIASQEWGAWGSNPEPTD